MLFEMTHVISHIDFFCSLLFQQIQSIHVNCVNMAAEMKGSALLSGARNGTQPKSKVLRLVYAMCPL